MDSPIGLSMLPYPPGRSNMTVFSKIHRFHGLILATSLITGLSADGVAAEKARKSPAEFVTQSVTQDEELKPYSGSAVERRKRLADRAASKYGFDFDLSELPPYAPKQAITGTLRFWGNNYIGDSGLSALWQEGFARFHPGIEFEWVLPTAAVAAPSLYFGLADIAMNHELTFYDYLANVRILGYEPTGFSVVTGSYDVSGWQNSMAIIVNNENPITRISLSQLDGIFGSQRAGGWQGTTWKPEFARGPEGNIRQWGQLGLADSWTDAVINTYGYSLRYATALEFSNRVLHASDKWNENLLAFGNYVSPEGVRSLQADQIMQRIENDLHGIAYIRWQSQFEGRVKVLALAEQDDGPYYDFSVENLQTRKYPLWGDQLFWVNVKPGTRIDSRTAEFIRFVLSREGQELVEEDGKYLPLSAAIAKEELARLESLE